MNGERESMGGRQNMPIDIDTNPKGAVKGVVCVETLFLVLPAIPNPKDAHRE